MKKAIFTIIVLALVAGLSGGGVWYWQKGSFDKTRVILEQENNKLKESLQLVKEKDSYSGWNTYADKQKRFEFKYPSDFVVIESGELPPTTNSRMMFGGEGVFLVNKSFEKDFRLCYIEGSQKCLVGYIDGVPNITVKIKKKIDGGIVKMALEESGASDIYNMDMFNLTAGNNYDYIGDANYLNYVDYIHPGVGNTRAVVVDLDKNSNYYTLVFSDTFLNFDDSILKIAKSTKNISVLK